MRYMTNKTVSDNIESSFANILKRWVENGLFFRQFKTLVVRVLCAMSIT